jgi:hypothetical protein
MALPGEIELEGEPYPLDYSVEEGVGVVRARIPAKLVYRIDDADVPVLETGRPLGWTVVRGKKDPIQAESLEAARLRLSEGGPGDRPRRKPKNWMEMETLDGAVDEDGRPRRSGQRKGPARGRRDGGGPSSRGAGGDRDGGGEGGPRGGGGRGRGPKPGGAGPGGRAKGRKSGGRRKARS